jgi:hypothetical protein
MRIDVSAAALWQAIGDFGAACQYLAMVVNCSAAGTGVGAVRTLTYADGSVITERLEVLDEAAHRLSYALLTDTPFRDCLTTVTVHDLGPGQCELAWSAIFEANGLPVGEAQEMLEGALELNSRALQRYITASAP